MADRRAEPLGWVESARSLVGMAMVNNDNDWRGRLNEVLNSAPAEPWYLRVARERREAAASDDDGTGVLLAERPEPAVAGEPRRSPADRPPPIPPHAEPADAVPPLAPLAPLPKARRGPARWWLVATGGLLLAGTGTVLAIDWVEPRSQVGVERQRSAAAVARVAEARRPRPYGGVPPAELCARPATAEALRARLFADARRGGTGDPLLLERRRLSAVARLDQPSVRLSDPGSGTAFCTAQLVLGFVADPDFPAAAREAAATVEYSVQPAVGGGGWFYTLRGTRPLLRLVAAPDAAVEAAAAELAAGDAASPADWSAGLEPADAEGLPDARPTEPRSLPPVTVVAPAPPPRSGTSVATAGDVAAAEAAARAEASVEERRVAARAARAEARRAAAATAQAEAAKAEAKQASALEAKQARAAAAAEARSAKAKAAKAAEAKAAAARAADAKAAKAKKAQAAAAADAAEAKAAKTAKAKAAATAESVKAKAVKAKAAKAKAAKAETARLAAVARETEQRQLAEAMAAERSAEQARAKAAERRVARATAAAKAKAVEQAAQARAADAAETRAANIAVERAAAAEARRAANARRALEAEAEFAPAARPSFDCRRARTRGERLVCGSERLAAADRAMSRLFYELRRAADPALGDDAQRGRGAFLARRDRCFSAACVEAVYNDRLDELEAIAAGGG